MDLGDNTEQFAELFLKKTTNRPRRSTGISFRKEGLTSQKEASQSTHRHGGVARQRVVEECGLHILVALEDRLAVRYTAHI